MRRTLVILVSIVLVAAAGLWSCERRFDNWQARSTKAHSTARAAFLADLPQEGCVTSGHVMALAEQRDSLARLRAKLQRIEM